MAEVFEAEVVGELGFTRKVAIKRMLAHGASDPRIAARFLDEARIASQLHHANIVAVTDVGLLDDLPFHVLEHVDGLTAYELQQLAGGTLPVEIALIIVAAVAHALDHAHGATDAAGTPLGVVHRDVKPANVLVSWGGDVKLSDFGIAFAHERGVRTETGMVAGTMGFIAPEQRSQGVVDGRADVFALGLTLCALITGNTPLRDVSVEMALFDGIPIPLPAEIPPDVRVALVPALAPARTDRPSSHELANLLGEILSKRLTRDPRSVLRDYLQRLQPARKVQGGALDALLGIEVEPASSRDDEVPRFRTVAAGAPGGRETPTVPATPRREARTDDPTTPETEIDPVPSRRRGLLAVAALSVLAIGGAGAWRMMQSTSDEVVAPSIDAGAVVSVVRDASVPDARVPIDALVTAIVAPDARVADKRRGSATSRPTNPQDPPNVVATTTVVERGWLQVVGEPLIGAKVLVDGSFIAYVPNAAEVPVGNHRVVVEHRDGTTLPAKEITITTFHSMKRPLRLTW